MVDLPAGVLSGGAYLTHVKSRQDQPTEPGNMGHFFIAIDTTRLGSSEWLAQRIADFANIVHETPRADPALPVRLPGEIELENMARHRRDGIEIDPAVLRTFEGFAVRR